MEKQYEKNGRDYDHHKRYGRRWQKIRSAYINAHPLCEMCMDEGRYVAAEEVHHKIPLKDGGTNEAENLQSLCRKHHAQVHAQMGTRTHGGVVYEFGDSHHR
ncbi:MAG: HNH endonuclease [Prevotella sp.]|nr:HNH endonuclease [Prevotella sp.]